MIVPVFIQKELLCPSNGSSRFIVEWVNKPTNQFIGSFVVGQNPRKVMEIGFLRGHAMSVVRSLDPEIDLYGIDIRQANKKIASRRLKFSPENDRLRIYKSGDPIPFQSNTFDVVYGVHVVYFYGDQRHEIKKAIEILKPGGKIILVTMSKDFLIKRYPGKNFKKSSPDEIGGMMIEGGCIDYSVNSEIPVRGGLNAIAVIGTKPA